MLTLNEMTWESSVFKVLLLCVKLSLFQVKIMKNPELLHTASEQFLGKKEHEIKSTVLQTLEGHLRFLNKLLLLKMGCSVIQN